MARSRVLPQEVDEALDAVAATGAPQSPPEVAGLVVWLSRLARAHEAVVAELNERHGLLRSETGVLVTLWFARDFGGLRPSFLAQALEQTTGGMTATLRRLESAGLVQRVADPADGRVSLARLTEKGASTGLESFQDMVGWFDEALGTVESPQREELLIAVRTLFSAVQAHRD